MLIPAQRGAPTLPAGEDPGSSGPLHPLPRTVVPLAAGPLHPAAPQGAAPGREEAAAGALPRLAEHVGRGRGRCTTASFTARRRPRGRHQSPAALGLSARRQAGPAPEPGECPGARGRDPGSKFMGGGDQPRVLGSRGADRGALPEQRNPEDGCAR